MAYTALARKWRPRTFAELIGQEAVVTALGNALREQRIAQAYLFSGIRGVGKTSAARLLAKALNCAEAPTAEPCNVCASCTDIASGASLDVLEIDAATYSKVEQIRDLTEGLRYGPSGERWKVVILDEIHRLSRQAFDALLKIVEEPPPFLVFVFATTEIDSVPATILSRCQEFHFRRVPTALLARQLRSLCEAENLTASESALRLLCRAAEGSVRDAVALLDQLATFGNGTITDEAAIALLGGGDTSTLPQLLADILAGDRVAVITATRRIETEGWDPRSVHHRLLALVRDTLHLCAGADRRHLDLADDEATRLAAIAQGTTYESLLRLLHHLLATEPLVRRSELPTLALEIGWLRACELPRIVAIESYLTGANLGPAPAPAAFVQPTPVVAGPPRTETTPRAPQAVATTTPSAPAQPSLTALLDALGDRRPALAARLRGCELELTNDRVKVAASPEDLEVLSNPAAKALLDEVAKSLFGDSAGLDFVRLAARAAPASPRPATAPATQTSERRAATVQEPVVQAVLDIFNGKVESEEPAPDPTEDNT